MINVTKTYLPPIEEYTKYLKNIWKTGWITNHGPLVKKLETKLKKYLGVKHLFFVSNGTTALQIAIKSLELKKKIITTPFSYVATTSSIVWENCVPVFVDINPNTLNIDANKIESAINKNTQAILATHVYGNPCDIEKIEKIAKKHNLKIIYDAAHAFGVQYKNKSLASYGDISILSFHATKIFHTVEGGAIITNNDKTAHKISYMRNFGHTGIEKPEDFHGIGINGKNSELHAAMGLCVLPKINQIIESRKKINKLYDKLLITKNLDIKKPKIRPNTIYNYSYYPIILPSEKILLKIKNSLNKQNIFPRRYFYPSLNKLNYVNSKPMEISQNISEKILCLPLYKELKENEIFKISKIITKIWKKK